MPMVRDDIVCGWSRSGVQGEQCQCDMLCMQEAKSWRGDDMDEKVRNRGDKWRRRPICSCSIRGEEATNYEARKGGKGSGADAKGTEQDQGDRMWNLCSDGKEDEACTMAVRNAGVILHDVQPILEVEKGSTVGKGHKGICWKCHVLHGPFGSGSKCEWEDVVMLMIMEIYLNAKMKRLAELAFECEWKDMEELKKWLTKMPLKGKHSKGMELYMWFVEGQLTPL